MNVLHPISTDKFLKLPEVSAITGRSKSAIYADIKAEIFPSPIPLSVRSVVWSDHEVRCWMSAKTAGKNEEQIKELIATLKSERQSFAV